MMENKEVKITERGWAGHFICAHQCLFRRNTLLEYKDKKIVVSTVGAMRDSRKNFTTVGHQRYYETMAFHSNKDDVRYHDADVSRQVSFDSPWAIDRLDADDEANIMHDNVVMEIKQRLLDNTID